MKKIICTILVALVIFTGVFCVTLDSPKIVAYAVTSKDVYGVAKDIINWKKSDVGSTENEYLINDTFLKQAGQTPGDWYPIGLGRLNISDNQGGYLAVINDNVQKRYNTKDKLDAAKATEWHRISLAVLACGGNPRAMGEDKNGDGRGDIDLIADGTYNRVVNGQGVVGKQGINGFIWALICIDSMLYEIPQGAFYTRDDLILNILNKQLSDGGWALIGEKSDPDITGMAIQALAPYYNSEKEYEYTQKGNKVVKKVRTAVDEALLCMSSYQLPSGDFESWNMANCESCVQMIVALCSLGVDIFSNKDFIKNGNTLYDGMLQYRTQSGGFTHSFVNDKDNPSAEAGKPNTMASEQALYGLASIIRMLNGSRRLYDFREEQTDLVKGQIESVKNSIDSLNNLSSTKDIKDVYDQYLQIDAKERSYVYNYYKLSKLLNLAGIEYAEEEIEYNSGDAGVVVPIEEFTDVDKRQVDNLPKQLTLKDRAEVLRLFNKINNCFDFDGKQGYKITLEKAKNEIDLIQKEVDSIKREIKDKLYPFNFIGLDKRDMVHQLYDRYLNLSEYDRTQFEKSDIEGLLKCKTQVDNLQTAVIVSVCVSIVVVVVICGVVLHIRSLKRKKASQKMEESDE